MAIRFDNGKVYHASSTKFDWFYSIYLKNYILRPACYECPFSKETRFADITIADYWEEKDDAYSLVICNSTKGCNILSRSNGEKPVQINKLDVKQPHMLLPCKSPYEREKFWGIYLKNGYLAVQKWYGNNTIKGYILNILARSVYALHLAWVVKRICKM